MPTDLPGSCLRLLEFQQGVIARWQAPVAGLDGLTMEARLRRQRGQPVYRGVYPTSTGEPAPATNLRAHGTPPHPAAAFGPPPAPSLPPLPPPTTPPRH